MIKRLVKLTFKEEHIASFRQLFTQKKTKIRDFQGCLHLELWQCTSDPCVFFTFSIWDSENDLNNYRDSDLFRETWQTTKAFFAVKAEAWSVQEQFS